MQPFDTFVVQSDCISSIDAVRSHPNVKNVIELPKEWVLYEFHHALFDDPDFLGNQWHIKMEQHPALKQARIEMLHEERALLTPWYEKKGTPFDSGDLARTQLTLYSICTLGKLSRVRLHESAGWGCSREFAIRFESPRQKSSAEKLQDVLRELTALGAGYGLECKEQVREPGALTVRLRSEVVSSHWSIALWVLLRDIRLKIGFEEMTYLTDAERDSFLGD